MTLLQWYEKKQNNFCNKLFEFFNSGLRCAGFLESEGSDCCWLRVSFGVVHEGLPNLEETGLKDLEKSHTNVWSGEADV